MTVVMLERLRSHLLFSPWGTSLVPEAWGILGELLVFILCWRPEEVGSNIVEGMQQRQDR